jgi:hypothetical protein
MGIRLLLLAVLAAVLALPAWGRDGARAPALRIVDRTPLTVAGTGFAPREEVRLTLRTGRARGFARAARADAAGAFRVAFDVLVAVEPCRGALVVTATGARGSRATVRRGCRPPTVRPPRVAG